MADGFLADVFVGSEKGYLKAVDLRKNEFHNVAKPSSETAEKRTEEICAMCWRNSNRNQILLGLRGGLVKTYDTDQSTFIDERDCDVKDSHFTGLFCYDSSLVTCTEAGLLRVWSENEPNIEIKVGSHISRMRHNQQSPNIVGTGGKENDLKIWDLEKSGQNIFRAKNVRNDSLDLRVPVWVTDFGFLPVAGSSKVVTGTGYHQIRLYDTAAKKRPVLSVDFEDCPVSSVCVTNQEHTVVVGNTAGTMSIVDLRKGLTVGSFKGFAGGIRCIEYCEETNQVAACGLDRFLRVYDFKSRNLLQKVYLKTMLNCLLFSPHNKEQGSESTQECEETLKENNNLRKRGKRKNVDEDDQEVDRIWDDMEVIKTDNIKHKKKSKKESTKTETKVKNKSKS